MAKYGADGNDDDDGEVSKHSCWNFDYRPFVCNRTSLRESIVNFMRRRARSPEPKKCATHKPPDADIQNLSFAHINTMCGGVLMVVMLVDVLENGKCISS